MIEKKENFNRREFIHAGIFGGILIAVLGGGGILWIDRQLFLRKELLQIISQDSREYSPNLLKFLRVLNFAERASLVKSFEENYTLSPEQILQELRWTSSNIPTYLFRHKFDFDYYALLQMSAYQLGIARQHVVRETTFSLEARMLHAMVKFFSENMWYATPRI